MPDNQQTEKNKKKKINQQKKNKNKKKKKSDFALFFDTFRDGKLNDIFYIWARFYAHYFGSRNVCSIFHNHPVNF